MTRVRMLTAIAGPSLSAHAGSELDLPARQARDLVDGGFAIDLDKQKADDAAKLAASRAQALKAASEKAEAERVAAEKAASEKAEKIESAQLALAETADTAVNRRGGK